jgi:outer membrane receptor for ferrienterochelin and colicins
MVRLNEILAEQTGLTIVTDHGKGIQMQGFSPEYTMIMIDGEPVIGRTSGTLELSRIATTNIDKIEIVKGPSSSLYGSEAMAGVINIITQKQKDGFSSSLSARYGTNNNADLSIESGFRKNTSLTLAAL